MTARSNLKYRAFSLFCFFLLCLALKTEALLYLENQFVSGYSSALNRPIFFSSSQTADMQKPSTGFDYLQKISDQYRDIAIVAVQGRLAWNESAEPKIDSQVYNAYLKFKGGLADPWIGRNRVAFGLSSYFDSHALLLPTLSMDMLGFDRDWGIGLWRDFDGGDFSLSATTVFCGRVSKGVLNTDNYNLGFSFAYNQTLSLAAVDSTYLINNLEFRNELINGEMAGGKVFSFLSRESLNLLDEGRVKLEAQEVVNISPASNYQLAVGLTYLASSSLTIRALCQYDSSTKDLKIIGQVYSYNLVQK